MWREKRKWGLGALGAMGGERTRLAWGLDGVFTLGSRLLAGLGIGVFLSGRTCHLLVGGSSVPSWPQCNHSPVGRHKAAERQGKGQAMISDRWP